MKPLEPLIGLSLLPTPYRAVLCCAVLMLFMLSDDTPPQYYIAYIETSLYFSHIFNFFFFSISVGGAGTFNQRGVHHNGFISFK